MSGLKATSSCTNGWKTCTDWCQDEGTDYYRMAYSPKDNHMYSTPVNFTGVSFRANGHGRAPRRLMSVGVRAAGPQCQSGWQGNGVACICTILYAKRTQVVYWRFEEGLDDAEVSEIVPDRTRRDSSSKTADTNPLQAIGSGGVHTLSLNNDLEFVTASGVPMHSVYAPQNTTFASLCLGNHMSIEFTGAQMLRTTKYAAMNTKVETSPQNLHTLRPWSG